MALSYKTRKRLALLILLVGLPIYLIVAVNVVAVVNAWFGRPHILIEFIIFVALGIVWILPFKSIFKGIGAPDPDADPESYPYDPPKEPEVHLGQKKRGRR